MILSNLIQTIEKDVKAFGFVGANKKAVERSGTKLKINCSSKTKQILQNKAVVIVANHPFEVETIALISSLPYREDIYLIINAAFRGIIKEIDKNLIPVYVRHHRYKANLNVRRLSGMIIDKYFRSIFYTEEVEHQKNRKNIAFAAKMVKKGGIVIIFPGRRSLTGKWFSGIGHLLNNIGLLDETYYLKAFIQGISNLDYLRLIPKIGKILPRIQVYFSEAQPIKEIVSWNKDPKIITQKLEQEYNQWAKALKK